LLLNDDRRNLLNGVMASLPLRVVLEVVAAHPPSAFDSFSRATPDGIFHFCFRRTSFSTLLSRMGR
jgi:hypothetical protein